MDITQYLEIFIEEAKEHLQNLNTSLLEMEKNIDDKNLINEIFRVAHTLKGMAATMGFKKMAKLTHDMENVLSEFRNGNMTADSNMLDVLFKCLDALESYVDNIINTSGEGDEDYENIIDSLNQILASKSEVPAKEIVKEEAVEIISEDDDDEEEIVKEEKSNERRKHTSITFSEFEKNALSKAHDEGYNNFGITIYINENCVLKSARAFIIFRALEGLGQIIKSMPAVQDIEDEKFDFDFSVFLVTKQNVEKVKKDLTAIAEVDDVLVDEVDALFYDVKTAVTEVEVVQEEQKATKAVKKTTTNNTTAEKPKAGRTVRVDIERLDVLMNLVSELIIIKNGLETLESSSKEETKSSNQNINEQIEYLERITTNLHDAVMKVRMVPVERVFNRFPRVIRDLSRKLDKKIELIMSGEDTELDRTVIDEIGDPLMHLIRNSADHGLETPKERVTAGKDEVGNVYLTAYQDGNNVVIEVSDNGKGIDAEKIKQSAIGKGVISMEQGETMTDQEIIDLIFLPSFSTAKKISDVSGRGVGLDVVKTKIAALGGDVEVESTMGKGSKFIIRLPLTLAIIQALMVSIRDEKYAIPLNTIQNIEDVKISDIKYIQNEEVINLRGQVIPIVRLNQILGIEEDKEPSDKITVVIVTKGDKKAGFVVDSLIGQQEIVIKTLGKYLNNIKLIAGATILGDGEVALILDVNSLI